MTASRAGRWAPPPGKGGVMMRSENVIGRIMRVISIAISVMLVVIVLVICAQTFFRYVVFKSLSWSEEVSRFLFAILVSWGICIGIQRDSLIRVDIIDKKFSPKAMHSPACLSVRCLPYTAKHRSRWGGHVAATRCRFPWHGSISRWRLDMFWRCCRPF